MLLKKSIICARNETPETCFFCETEGKGFCNHCADNDENVETEWDKTIERFIFQIEPLNYLDH